MFANVRSDEHQIPQPHRMRAQQIGSVQDVEWAILESDGNMSFIPK